MKYRSLTAIGVGLFVALSVGTGVRATIIETDNVSTTSQTAFDSLISNTDLINTGRPTLASAAQVPTLGSGAGGIAPTHDGSAASSAWTTIAYVDNTAVLTYQLNLNPLTGGNADGYDITSVRYIGGWDSEPTYSGQHWDLKLATLSNPTFTTVGTVLYFPGSAHATMVSLSGSTGRIATEVTGIQIALHNDFNSVSVLHEIDAFGTMSIPEPSTLILLGAGGWILFWKRPNRRQS